MNKTVVLLMLTLLSNGLSGTCEFLLSKYSLQPMMKSVSGIIVDKGGDPLNGCSVLIKGTSSNTISDICGEFILPVEEEFTIVFQSMSYEDQRTFELRLSASEVTGEKIVFQIGRSKLKNRACKKEFGKRLKKFIIG